MMDRQTQTDMTKLIVAFRSFENAPQNEIFRRHFPLIITKVEILCLLVFRGIEVILPLLADTVGNVRRFSSG
jgi:hypothetical protein